MTGSRHPSICFTIGPVAAEPPRTRRRIWSALALASSAIVTLPVPAFATERSVGIAVEAGPLDSALLSLSQQTGIAVFVDPMLVKGRTTASLRGTMTIEQALTRMLSGTGLSFRRNDDGGYVVLRASPRPVAAAYPQSRAAAAPSAVPARPEERADNGGIGDIVVYGQLKGTGESQQRVPIAITAVDANLIAATNSVDITDIGSLSPNVRTPTVGTTPGFPNFTIRGIGTISSIRSVDPAVNIFQDGMVFAYQAGAIGSTFDLESIEVLRGPQGVLFGRNSSGGVISMRTRRPGKEFQALTDISYGNYDTLDAAASIEGPLGTDAVLGKIAVLYRHTDGFIRNTNNGTFVPAPGNPTGQPQLHRTGRIGAQDHITVKPTFLFTISDGTTLTLLGQYQRYNDDGSTPRAFVPASGSYQLQTVFGFTPDDGKYETNLRDAGYLRLRSGHVIAELVNAIGDGQLTTIGAWRKIRFDSSVNVNGSPFDLLIFPDNREKNEQFSVESRLNYPLLDTLDLTAGVYYLDSTTEVTEKRLQSVFPNMRYILGQFDQTTKAIAGFANLDWTMMEGLKLSVGGRYSSEKKEFTGSPLTPCVGQGFGNCPQSFTSVAKRWNDFSPRLVLTYQAEPRALIFASYTQGFRSGNINSRVTTALGFTPANPENVTSYEIGTKLDLLDRTLRVNVSAFLTDYSDIQQVLTGSFGDPPVLVQTLVNAASARTQGIEAEITIKPDRSFQFDASFGYVDAKFKDFTVPIPGVADPTRLEFARVPKYSVMLAGTYRWGLGNLPGEFSARVSYDFRSAFFTDTQNTTEQPAYGLLNANLAYNADNWSIALFGRNLGNVDYVDNIGGGPSLVKFGGQPRTYGLRFTTRFR